MTGGAHLPANEELPSDESIRRLLNLPPRSPGTGSSVPTTVSASGMARIGGGHQQNSGVQLRREGDSILMSTDPNGVIPPLRVLHEHDSDQSTPTSIGDKLLMMLIGRLANSSLASPPAPLSPPVRVYPGSPMHTNDMESAGEFNYDDEETFAINDEIFYRKDEDIRRQNSRYLEESKNLFDLNIVMPFSVPSGTIAVDVNSGDHFYAFKPIVDSPPSKPPNGQTIPRPHPAQLLFGRGVAATHVGFRRRGNRIPSSDDKSPISQDVTAGSGSSACDTWASFLNLRLGTIFNVRADQMRIVCELFKKCFDASLCQFYVPISMECRGVFPSPDDSVSLQRQRRTTAGGPKITGGGEKYETRGSLLTSNDQKRFRMIRRHLKKFGYELANHFGGAGGAGTFSPNYKSPPLPQICVELHENCKTEKFDSGIRVMIREWSKLSDPVVLKKIWRAMGNAGVGLANETSREAYGIVQMGEVRLEHTHLRMVDPRWPEELVVGRRLADHQPESDLPGPPDTQARFTFCSRLDPVHVTYLNNFHDLPTQKPGVKLPLTTAPWDVRPLDPDQSIDLRIPLLSGPFSPIVMDHLRYHPNAGLPQSCSVQVTTPTTDAEEDNRPSLPAQLQKILSATPQFPFLNVPTPKAPPAPCKFYLRGFCVRGTSCYFLHPADRELESRTDVREIPRNHPKFYN